MLELSHFLPRDVIEDPYLTPGARVSLHSGSYYQLTRRVNAVSAVPIILPDLFVVAADGQKLATGAPGHRLDAQRPLVGTVSRQQTAVQRIQQNFVLHRKHSY